MKTVGSRWRNLAAGYEKLCQLDAELRTQWRPRVEKAHQRKVEAELAEWESRQQQRSQEYQRALSTWTQAVADQQERLRTEVGSDVHRARRVVPVGILIFVALALLDGDVDRLPLMIFLGMCLGLVIAFVPSLFCLINMSQLKSEKPLAPAGESTPEQDPMMSLSIADRWWRQISDAGGPIREAFEYGDEGEEVCFRYLTDVLPDEHVGVRSVLVKRRLDVDVLVVGPTAVWIFEVKHWRGTIVCRQGRWNRVKSFHGPGGVLMNEEQEIKEFDRQWLHERTQVAETLRRRLAPPLSDLRILGGLVFTHDDVAFEMDSSVRCEYGNIEYWAERLGKASQGRREVIDQSGRLKIVDALLRRADSVTDEPTRYLCSVELAERIFAEMTDSVKQYLARQGE